MKPNNCSKCPWNNSGEVFNACPFLLHSVYPYFLTLLYGGKFTFNQDGDCDVCCPAVNGVDVLIKKRTENGWWDIYAEIVQVGNCPHGHKVGEKIVFPVGKREQFTCPALINNVFPFLNLPVPECIDLNNLRCPDWVPDMTIRVKI